MCDPETRKNCATLKESLMDIDSNFDEDYNSVNALKKKKKETKTNPKKKVTFDCADENSSNEETFDYEHDDDNSISDDELEDEVLSDDEILDEECENENMSDEECIGSDHEFDYDHEEEFEYNHEKEQSSEDQDSEFDEDISDNSNNIKGKTKNMKEDIYGRIRKPDGTVVVRYLFYYF